MIVECFETVIDYNDSAIVEYMALISVLDLNVWNNDVNFSTSLIHL